MDVRESVCGGCVSVLCVGVCAACLHSLLSSDGISSRKFQTQFDSYGLCRKKRSSVVEVVMTDAAF